jgi:hypothetical protein
VIFNIWIGHRNKIGRTSSNYGSRVNQPGFVVFQALQAAGFDPIETSTRETDERCLGRPRSGAHLDVVRFAYKRIDNGIPARTMRRMPYS